MRSRGDTQTANQPFELDDVLADAPFAERHTRRIDLPIEQVWPAALALKGSEIRTMGPLLALRELPSKLLGRLPERSGEEPSFLDAFAAEGFIVARRDDAPTDGRALILFGAAGKFWKPVGNQAVAFESPSDYVEFDQPGYAVIAATMEAIDRGDHTELITETRVAGTDRASTRRFAPYWALIRLPSGLIRRSWLAAIERSARAG